MARLFIQYLGTYSNVNLPKSFKILPDQAHDFAKYYINPPKMAKDIETKIHKRQIWSHWLSHTGGGKAENGKSGQSNNEAKWKPKAVEVNTHHDGKIFMKFLSHPLTGTHARTHTESNSVTRFGEIPPLWQMFKKSLAIYLRFIWFWAKFSTHFGTICMLLGKFHCWKRPNIENTIWSSGHTAPHWHKVNIIIAKHCPTFMHVPTVKTKLAS